MNMGYYEPSYAQRIINYISTPKPQPTGTQVKVENGALVPNKSVSITVSPLSSITNPNSQVKTAYSTVGTGGGANKPQSPQPTNNSATGQSLERVGGVSAYVRNIGEPASAAVPITQVQQQPQTNIQTQVQQQPQQTKYSSGGQQWMAPSNSDAMAGWINAQKYRHQPYGTSNTGATVPISQGVKSLLERNAAKAQAEADNPRYEKRQISKEQYQENRTRNVADRYAGYGITTEKARQYAEGTISSLGNVDESVTISKNQIEATATGEAVRREFLYPTQKKDYFEVSERTTPALDLSGTMFAPKGGAVGLGFESRLNNTQYMGYSNMNAPNIGPKNASIPIDNNSPSRLKSFISDWEMGSERAFTNPKAPLWVQAGLFGAKNMAAGLIIPVKLIESPARGIKELGGGILEFGRGAGDIIGTSFVNLAKGRPGAQKPMTELGTSFFESPVITSVGVAGGAFAFKGMSDGASRITGRVIGGSKPASLTSEQLARVPKTSEVSMANKATLQQLAKNGELTFGAQPPKGINAVFQSGAIESIKPPETAAFGTSYGRGVVESMSGLSKGSRFSKTFTEVSSIAEKPRLEFVREFEPSGTAIPKSKGVSVTSGKTMQVDLMKSFEKRGIGEIPREAPFLETAPTEHVPIQPKYDYAFTGKPKYSMAYTDVIKLMKNAKLPIETSSMLLPDVSGATTRSIGKGYYFEGTVKEGIYGGERYVGVAKKVGKGAYSVDIGIPSRRVLSTGNIFDYKVSSGAKIGLNIDNRARGFAKSKQSLSEMFKEGLKSKTESLAVSLPELKAPSSAVSAISAKPSVRAKPLRFVPFVPAKRQMQLDNEQESYFGNKGPSMTGGMFGVPENRQDSMQTNMKSLSNNQVERFSSISAYQKKYVYSIASNFAYGGKERTITALDKPQVERYRERIIPAFSQAQKNAQRQIQEPEQMQRTRTMLKFSPRPALNTPKQPKIETTDVTDEPRISGGSKDSRARIPMEYQPSSSSKAFRISFKGRKGWVPMLSREKPFSNYAEAQRYGGIVSLKKKKFTGFRIEKVEVGNNILRKPGKVPQWKEMANRFRPEGNIFIEKPPKGRKRLFR